MTKEIYIAPHPEELPITQQYPEIMEQPEILTSLLMPLETYLLRIMMLEKKPLNTQTLYNKVVKQLFAQAITLKRLPAKIERHIKHLQEGLFYTSKSNYTVGFDDLIHWKEEPSAQQIRDMTIILTKLKKNAPSVYKIDKTMETLESWGFVSRRYENTERSKYFWVVQPAFNIKYGRVIRKYLAEYHGVLEY